MDRPLVVSIVVVAVAAALILAVVLLAPPPRGSVTFQETGLPPGYSWFVTIDNVTHASPLDAITVSLAPGTYAYSVSLANSSAFTPYPGGGTVALTAAGRTLNISFVRASANVTFRETGLPAGVVWTVAEGSTFHNSNATTLRIPEANGEHHLRVLVAANETIVNPGPTWIEVDLYIANVTRWTGTVNGTDVAVDLGFTPLLRLNETMFPIYVFANQTQLGAPAYEDVSVTPYRYTVANLSFSTPTVDNVSQNATGYVMTASQFDAFVRTGSPSSYYLTTGNVSGATLSLNLASGTWYLMVTGWGVDETHAVGLGFYFTFPGTDAIFG